VISPRLRHPLLECGTTKISNFNSTDNECCDSDDIYDQSTDDDDNDQVGHDEEYDNNLACSSSSIPSRTTAKSSKVYAINRNKPKKRMQSKVVGAKKTTNKKFTAGGTTLSDNKRHDIEMQPLSPIGTCLARTYQRHRLRSTLLPRTKKLTTMNNAIAPEVLQPYTLIEKHKDSPDSCILKFSLPRKYLGSNPYLPTCIKVEYKHDEQSKIKNKSYSPISHPNTTEYFELLVKAHPCRPGGGVGAYLSRRIY